MALTHDDKWSSSSSSSGQACLSCGCGPVSGRATRRKRWNIINAFYYVVRLIAAAFSAALTLLFADPGALKFSKTVIFVQIVHPSIPVTTALRFSLFLYPLSQVLTFCNVPNTVLAALSCLISAFNWKCVDCQIIAGAFAGGIAGALAGWVSNAGIIYGVAVVAIAGATIAMEFLDALRTYWHSGSPGSYGSSSMADFLQELVHGRFVNEQIEQLPPATSSTHDLQQVNRSNASYGQSNAGASEVSSSGLSADSLKRLPCHVLLDEMKACCTICLQDIGVGDTARSLPQCHHTFHLACVDRWLVIHGSCPVCRQDV